MNNNQSFQPGEETFEDVEGHAARFKGALPQEPAEDDVEGHAARFKGALPQEPAEDDDTEGHGVRVRV